VRDGGVPGVTIRLGGAASPRIAGRGRTACCAGAAALDVTVSRMPPRPACAGLGVPLAAFPARSAARVRDERAAPTAAMSPACWTGREVVDALAATVARLDQPPTRLRLPALRRLPPGAVVVARARSGRSPRRPGLLIAARDGRDPSRARGRRSRSRARTGGSTFRNPAGPRRRGS
jgi:hypothetical protein